jgi:hypothetical protein
VLGRCASCAPGRLALDYARRARRVRLRSVACACRVCAGQQSPRRAISVPLTPVIKGVSRSLTGGSRRWSGGVSGQTVQIPKLTVRLRAAEGTVSGTAVRITALSPAAWNGSWNGSTGKPWVLGAAAALSCGIGAGSGLEALQHASCKRTVSGSNPLTGSKRSSRFSRVHLHVWV